MPHLLTILTLSHATCRLQVFPWPFRFKHSQSRSSNISTSCITKKRARAGNLAMALTGASDFTGSSHETLGSLFSILVPAVHKALNSTYSPSEEHRNSQAETAAPVLMIPPPPPPPPPPPAFRRANTFCGAVEDLLYVAHACCRFAVLFSLGVKFPSVRIALLEMVGDIVQIRLDSINF